MSKRRKIKIAVLLPSLQVGGAERLVMEELAYLKDDPRFSFELHLVFEKGPFYDSMASLGVPIRVWNAPHKSIWMLKTYLDIIRYLHRTHCDILHSHLLDSIGPIVGKLAGAKVVATVHNDKRYGVTKKLVLRRSDLVLGCGRKVLQNVGGFIASKKIGVLNNAIQVPDRTFFQRNDMLKRYGFREGSKLVVSLGRLIKEKGFDVLIKAFRQVVEEVPNAVLLIGGVGEEKGLLNELVKSEGLEEHVKLPGLISNVNEVLSSCDVYVNSSRWEGLPMTLLEAMAHGRPIVATDVGGNAEVIRDGQTGLLVPPENPAALAEAILKLLQDISFGGQLGRQARDLFEREYTIQRHCEKLADYYLRLLNG